ncbi:MAG: SDR family NAD(P)-dependent oxidoreductase [Holosporaceae bacterium]|jgi:acyl transferase domain-containing protein/acyl carrier protein|nr:SDR family NAD(P)-dependent oxidoreductase [Holosporaceae bacterium]
MNEKIAIIGYSAQVGNTDNASDLWNLILNHQTSIEKLENVDDSRKPYGSYIKNSAQFDCNFFGYSPNEATYIDPQQRLFLKHAWLALEMAGESNFPDKNKIGVFAACGINTYLLNNILSNSSFEDLDEDPFSLTGNSCDFLSTRVAYKFNCKGSCATIQSGCSSSLVALHMAKQSLIMRDNDLMIVGGVHITDYEKEGYSCIEGGVSSASGNCRAFDKNADGTVFTSGVGVVILKRLNDAIADRNKIYGIIEESAINNDGSDKAGFTAPSLKGQSDLIYDMISKSSIDVENISYIETHGTATALGDTIEYLALENAYKKLTNKRKFCKLGALKNNIGHTDVSAGILGVIKILMSFSNEIRPSIFGFTEANEKINLDDSPFVFSKNHDDWPAGTKTAAVTALGIGGTNSHIILSEYKDDRYCKNLRSTSEFFLVSAKEDAVLNKHVAQIEKFAKNNFDIAKDIAFSINCGRKGFNHRAAIYWQGFDDCFVRKNVCEKSKEVIFAFPGQGSQYNKMALELYGVCEFFRKTFDEVVCLFEKEGILELKEKIFSDSTYLYKTFYTQPALFCVEYSLAKFLIYLRIVPKVLLGHSLGEYVAYAISGILHVDEAIKLVACRAKLLDSMKNGAMLSVNAGQEYISDLLEEYKCDIAAYNSPELLSISGLHEDINALKDELEKQNILFKDIHTSAAFHSRYIESILKDFRKECENIKFSKADIPIISNITGELIYEISCDYLLQHMRTAVNFVSMTKTVSGNFKDNIIVEIGPGRTINTLIKMNGISDIDSFCTMKGHHEKTKSDYAVLYELLSNLWLHGVDINFNNFYEDHFLRKISLPTYPFSEKECYLKPNNSGNRSKTGRLKVQDWFYERCFVAYGNDINETNYKKEFVKIEDVFKYQTTEIEHLIIEISDDTEIDHFISVITLIQNYSERIASVKRIDFVAKSNGSSIASIYKAFTKCIAQEMSFLNLRFIEANNADDGDFLAKIINSDISENYLKLIDRKVYVIDYIKKNHVENSNDKKYKNILIIGGFGRMSGYYANAFSKLVDGKIIIASRSLQNNMVVNENDVKDNFKSSADKLCTANLDVTDANSVEQCFHWIDKNFGGMDLVIHAAGVDQSDHMRRTCDIKSDYVLKVLKPKIDGLKNIKTIQDQYEFKVLVVSSISSVLGGIDLLIYSASHDFIDDFSERNGWAVHNWDALSVESSDQNSAGSLLDSIAIKDKEALSIPVLAPQNGSVIISTIDLRKRAKSWTSVSETENAGPKTYADRPPMRSVYVPPSDEFEKKMHDLWREFLGFERIGINDNFFELGGDSLLALRLVRVIAKRFNWPIKTVDLFEFPTIRSIVQKYSSSEANLQKDSEISDRIKKKQQYFDKLKKQKGR